VYIPKASNRPKLRPLGIPVLMDRCHQGRVRIALEPEWEARFEARSYGFHPGEAAPMRSPPYTPLSKGHNPNECGFWTPIWQPRSTKSITTGYWLRLDRFRHGK
jgi:hypothetical protein